MATPGNRKAPVDANTDSDVEMVDQPRTNVLIDLTTPSPEPSSPGLDDPEREWAAEINDDMFEFPDSPGGPRSTTSEHASPEQGDFNLGSPRARSASPVAGRSPQDFEAHRQKARLAVQGIKESFIGAPGAPRRATEMHAGERIHDNLHSLNAVRVSIGFVEAHLSDLMWLQDRLVEYHGNLLRTHNLAQKAVEGISRAIYMRERQDEMYDATVERET